MAEPYNERKPDLLRTIAQARRRNPYLRLGQLLVNAVPLERDLFYVEDEDLAAYLREFGRKP